MCWGKEVMAHFVFGTILVAVLGAPFIAISYAAAAITTTRPWVAQTAAENKPEWNQQ